jgi:Fic family protein
MMFGLMDDAGRWRNSGVGIFQEQALVHIAPPASQIPRLMADLLNWLATTDHHPLISSCVFHYEFEFIHPFSDGNGCLWRLWQTLILSQWRTEMAFLPVESIIKEQQSVLGIADQQSDWSRVKSHLEKWVHIGGFWLRMFLIISNVLIPNA